MRRHVSLEEISDGRLYGKNDMVRACTGDCRGCSACCGGMGNSVILDPLDIYRLTVGLGLTFEELMADKIELNVVDGVILPNLKMSTGNETCAFLDEAGRCSIHAQRPGICRLFPLGRYYMPEEEAKPMAVSGSRTEDSPQRSAGSFRTEDSPRRSAGGFRYFLQVHECPMPNKTKVKVSKWIDTPELDRYERFVNDWHYFLEDVQKRLEAEQPCAPIRQPAEDGSADGAEQPTDEEARKINLLLLKLFFARPYEEGDFYAQFEERLAFAKEALGFA